MFDTELGNITLAVNDLWIIIIPLSLNLLGWHFLEDIGLSLMHAHHIGIDRWTLVVRQV